MRKITVALKANQDVVFSVAACKAIDQTSMEIQFEERRWKEDGHLADIFFVFVAKEVMEVNCFRLHDRNVDG